jgi:cyanophycinase
MSFRVALIVGLFLFCASVLRGDPSPATQSSQRRGTLILGGGDIRGASGTAIIKKRFVDLAGGSDANFVIIQSNRDTLPVDMILAPDDAGAFDFGVKHVITLCTHKRDVANSDEFVAPIRAASGVWITGGKVTNLDPVYRDTLTQRELKAILDRGGVIGGESAGAMIQASDITDSIKVPAGAKASTTCYPGFGFLPNVVIAPHIIKMGWTESLVPIVAAHPDLLGIGIDERAAIVVQGSGFEVIGESKVAIYDNQDHGQKRYYFLSPGDRFDLRTRTATTQPSTKP